MVNSINFSDKTNRNRQIRDALIASSSGVAVGYFGHKGLKDISRRLFKFNPDNFKLNNNEQDLFLAKANEVIDRSNLKNFGLKIEIVNKNTPEPADIKFKKIFRQIIAKKNACYRSNEKTIYINKEFITPIFHELGHAENHCSGFSTKLTKSTKLIANKYFLLGLPLLALGTSSKIDKNDEKLSTSNKVFNAARLSSGVFASLALVPRIIEEYYASKKGLKFAKQTGLNLEHLNLINKIHKIGLNSYARTAGIFALSSSAAIITKDIVQHILRKHNA